MPQQERIFSYFNSLRLFLLHFPIWLTSSGFHLPSFSFDPRRIRDKLLIFPFLGFLGSPLLPLFCFYPPISILRLSFNPPCPAPEAPGTAEGCLGSGHSHSTGRSLLTRHTVRSFLCLFPGVLGCAGQCLWGVKWKRQRNGLRIGRWGSKNGCPEGRRPFGGSQAERSRFSSTWGLTCWHCLIIGLLAVVLGGVVSRAATNLADGVTMVHTYRKKVV